MPTTNPTAARRPPACTPEYIAELDDFDDVADVVDDGLDPDVPEGEVLLVVEFEDGEPSAAEALAFAWNSSNVSFAARLTANTMPFWQ